MQGINSFLEVVQKYFSGNALIILSLIGVLYLGAQKKVRTYVCGIICGAILLLYNGISYKIVCKLGESEAYYRFFWVIPVAIIDAYIIIELWNSQKEKWKKIMIAGIMAAAFLLYNQIPVSDWIKIPDNIYQLDNNVIQIADLMDEISGGQRVKFMDNGTLRYSMREYNANICEVINETLEINQIIYTDRADFTGSYVRTYAAYNEVDFIAVEKTRISAQKVLESGGLTKCGTSDDYILYYVDYQNMAEDNEQLSMLLSDSITDIDVEYVEIPGLQTEKQFIYTDTVTDEVKQIAAEYDADIITTADTGENEIQSYDGFAVALIDNSDEVTQSVTDSVKQLADSGQAVIAFLKNPIQQGDETGIAGALLGEESNTAYIFAGNGSVESKELLDNKVLQYVPGTEQQGKITLIRVKGLEYDSEVR